MAVGLMGAILTEAIGEGIAGVTMGKLVCGLRVATDAGTPCGFGAALGRSAAFLSAGGYHHHIGFNTWVGEGAPPPPPDEYASSVRKDLHIDPDQFLFLQPTRIVRRKGIEQAIELVRRLPLPARLVISHASGDEGDAYEKHLRSFSQLLDISTIFVADIISDQRGMTADGRKVYSLWDVYPFADIVTYPSLLEGFGNAFLESVYFRRPIVVNDYTIYGIDIKPKGFRAIELDGFITDEAVAEVEQILKKPALAAEMAEHNYQLAKRFYSFAFLEHQLQGLLQSFTGEDVRS